MTKKERREGDRRPSDRRDAQPDDDQQRRPGEAETQEGDSLTALKVILAKVAALLAPLKLTQDESISLVEQLYGGVLEMDLKLAGETDDKRESSVLAHIQNTKITRNNGKIVVEYPASQEPSGADGSKSKTDAKAPPAKQPQTKPAADKTAGAADAAADAVQEPEQQVTSSATTEPATDEKNEED
jgi:hypothetical protein